jgi:uncharacterized protein YceK
MLSRFKVILLTFSGAFLVGCSSLEVHSAWDRKPHLYPGVREDVDEIARLWSGPFGFCLVWIPVIDMPFSFVVDTLYLPFDAHYKHQVSMHQESLKRFPPDPNPLKVWKHTPNVQPDPAIVADYESYIEQLPQDQRKVLIVNDYMVRLFEDGNRAHAIEIRLYLKHTEWKHVLIYDESNKRVEVLKYADGRLVP